MGIGYHFMDFLFSSVAGKLMLILKGYARVEVEKWEFRLFEKRRKPARTLRIRNPLTYWEIGHWGVLLKTNRRSN